MRYSIIAGLSALIMMIVSFNINVNASEKYDTTDIRIGTTGYIISAPSDYYSADVTEKERRDDMIAYYKSDKLVFCNVKSACLSSDTVISYCHNGSTLTAVYKVLYYKQY